LTKGADKGSVVSRDHAVKILAELGKTDAYAETAFGLLLEQLMQCPPNQFPMYAELTLPLVTAANKTAFIETLTARLPEPGTEAKRRRVAAVIGKTS
jgi:hypothetical protein